MAAIAHPGSAQAVIVHGRVFDNAGHLARGVAVSIIGRPSGSTATANTDTAGRYAATFTDGDSVYVLTYRKVGFAAFTQTARLAGLSGFVDVPDVALGGGPNVLQPIVARVNQERVPIAAPGDYPSVGGTEMNLLANAAFLADPSDISGLALSLPGIFGRGDSGFSVLGAATTQNRTLVDGADFGGGSLPRDAVMTGSVVTSSSDPSRGEFAGGATVLTTRPGSARVAATVRAQLIDPHLAWGDPDAPAPPSRTVFASGFVTGPLGSAKVATYRLSVDASERTSDLPTLLAPRATLLQQEGVSLDSLAAVAHALTTLGTPLTAGGVPSEPTSDRASAVLRIDHRVNSSTSFNFAATGNWSRNAGQGIGELSFPSLGTRSSSALMHYALNGTTYLHRVLESVHVTLNAGSTHADPYLASPAASVLVGTTYADARTGLVALRFGGAGGGTTDNDTRSWAVNNEIAWAASNYKNQLKFTQEIKSESGTVDQAANAFGTYVYQSAADLLANAPASFTRMLSSAAYDYRGTSVALSLGDTWRPRPNILEFQGGLRFDDEYFGHDPAFNAGLDSLFGVRTDRVPGNDGISPRFGFSWIPGGRKDGQLPAGVTTRAIGLAGTRPPPADVTGTGLLPSIRRVKITGSIGAYRGVIAPSQVGALQGTTGLANATTTLSCVGAATPTPDWAAPVIANSCVNGNTTYAATLPTVRVFDPAFHPPVTWRGVLSVAGLRAHGWWVNPQVTYSAGVNVESAVDANLQSTPQFVLPSEGNRPVFAPPAGIVSETGLFAPAASSLTSGYGRVITVRSDLAYHTEQLSLALSPPKPLFGHIPVYLIYALNAERMEQRGFGGTTAGNPLNTEWVNGGQPVHQFTLGANNMRLWWFTVSARLAVYSGVSYTPVVANDINGDGLANDRAFVPDPARAADTALAHQITGLLAQAPSGARQCLTQQLGVIAGANSCRTPWHSQFDLNVNFTPPPRLQSGSRLHVLLTMLNAGSALVRLFGLQNTALGQSTASAAVDPRLLYVTGFDPTANRFVYRVNQLFGEPLDYGVTHRVYPPFELQLGLEYRLGYPPIPAAVKRIALRTASDTMQLIDRTRQALARQIGRNPVDTILALRDSLQLGGDQIAELQRVRGEYQARFDTMGTPLTSLALREGHDLDANELFSRTGAAFVNASRALRAAEQARAIQLLLPAQRETLSRIARIP